MAILPSVASYVYNGLKHTDSVRLLQLNPNGNSDALLSGELREARLDDTLDFEALSYAWGEEQCQPHPLLLSNACLPISETLSAALKLFRLTDRPRNLWIDAICINQDDIKERSHQVARMSMIYRSATEVLVWLGEGTDATVTALQLLQSIAENGHQVKSIGFTRSQGPNWFGFDSRTLEGSYEDAMRLIESTVDSKLDDILDRPWFTRLWIIQEIVLAESAALYCGHASLDWSTFAIALSVLKAAMNTTEMGIAGLSSFEKAWHVVDTKATLQVTRRVYFASPYNDLRNLLYRVKDQRCKDDRDRIYALFGLDLLCTSMPVTLASGITSSLTPDYSKSTPEVYVQVARHYIMQSDLFILYDAGLWRRLTPIAGCSAQEYRPDVPPQSSDYLPSWVPDFSKAQSLGHIPWYNDDLNAGLLLSLAQGFIDPSAPHRIHLKGKTIDVVKRRIGVLGLATCGNLFETICGLAKACTSACLEQEFQDSTLSTIDHYLLPLTLMADGAINALKGGLDLETRVHETDVLEMWRLFQKHCLRETGEIRRRFEELSHNKEPISSYHILNGSGEDARIAFKVFDALCDVFEDCQFMISECGRTGLMPTLAELGDMIVVFPGATTPFILRKVQDREDAVIIGPCYVQGVMNGEAVRSTFRWESISLI